MKKNIIFLILCSILIMIVFIYNVKIDEKTKEIIKLKSEKFISNYEKKNLIMLEYDYITEQTTQETTINYFEKIGTLLPNDITPIISKMGYKVSTKSFKDVAKETENIHKNIIIEYPQLIGFKNKVLQNKINKEIKDSALEPYYRIKKEYLGDISYHYDNMNWIVNYTIEYIDKNVISIVFRGHRYTIGFGARGTYKTYATNINLNTGKRIRIDELFNDSFKNVLAWDKLNHCFFNTIYVKVNENMYKNAPDSDPIVSRSYLFDKSYDNFYIKENKFMFISFIKDDDWTLAADYSDLMDSIKWENEVWAGIFKKERG